MTEPTSAKRDLRNVKVALWGFGNQNKLMSKYLHERNIPIVAVISHHDTGKDYTTVDLHPWGKKLGGTSGVKIVDEPDAKATLLVTQPDICIMCTRSTIEDLQPSLTVCAESKVNVITIAEELLDSRTSSPALTKEINALFRENGVTLTGSGFEDVACCEMTMMLSSMMHRIHALEGFIQYNLDDYGQVLAEVHGVGLTSAQFQKDIAENPQYKFYVYNVNEWFVSALHLTKKGTTERREPIFASKTVWSTCLKREILVGECTGMKVITTTTTKEGITIEVQAIGKCYEPNDFDQSTWGFQGEPSGVKFTMTNVQMAAMTNTATISRILQVIDAPAGYITSDKLQTVPRYEHWT